MSLKNYFMGHFRLRKKWLLLFVSLFKAIYYYLSILKADASFIYTYSFVIEKNSLQISFIFKALSVNNGHDQIKYLIKFSMINLIMKMVHFCE